MHVFEFGESVLNHEAHEGHEGVTKGFEDSSRTLVDALTYLKLSPYRVGFLMNFNVPLFKQGLKRFVL